jgi:hypothetical protein
LAARRRRAGSAACVTLSAGRIDDRRGAQNDMAVREVAQVVHVAGGLGVRHEAEVQLLVVP